jgi:hypothetical protein
MIFNAPDERRRLYSMERSSFGPADRRKGISRAVQLFNFTTSKWKKSGMPFKTAEGFP